MSKHNDKKASLLGMPIGTATHKLRKNVLFSLVCKAGLNKCFRCQNEIISSSDMSIEHKEAWMGAADPLASFFDLENIAFSHLSCNCSAASKPNQLYASKGERDAARSGRRRDEWSTWTKEKQQRVRREKYLKHGK